MVSRCDGDVGLEFAWEFLTSVITFRDIRTVLSDAGPDAKGVRIMLQDDHLKTQLCAWMGARYDEGAHTLHHFV